MPGSTEVAGFERADPTPAAVAAAGVMRGCATASLGTFDALSGHPYVSLVTVALDHNGAPVLLLSELARHTRNIHASNRVSLLFHATPGIGDPLAVARVTVLGTVAITSAGPSKTAFLVRHPDAKLYAGFADFKFYRLDPISAHLIGGFGRIVEIEGCDLMAALQSTE